MARSIGRTIWVYIRNALLVVLAIVVVWGGFAYVEDRNYRQRLEKVEIVLFHKSQCDDPARPLMIGIKNGTNQTINVTHFDIQARRPGHSTNLARGGYMSWDRIIRPGDGMGACWPYPRLMDEGYRDPPTPSQYKKEDLEWSVTRSFVDFAE